MSKSTKVKYYEVMAKLSTDCTLKISAESLDDAIKKARELEEGDFVEVHGDLNDSSLHIYGVYES